MIPGIKIIKKIRAHTGCSNWTGWSQLNCSFWKNKLKFHCRTVKFRSRLFIRVEWNTMEFKKAWPWISFYGVEPFEPFRTISNREKCHSRLILHVTNDLILYLEYGTNVAVDQWKTCRTSLYSTYIPYLFHFINMCAHYIKN